MLLWPCIYSFAPNEQVSALVRAGQEGVHLILGRKRYRFEGRPTPVRKKLFGRAARVARVYRLDGDQRGYTAVMLKTSHGTSATCSAGFRDNTTHEDFLAR